MKKKQSNKHFSSISLSNNFITYNELMNNKLNLCLTMICLHNDKSKFYEFYNNILFMLK
jgi:hypothetical protein